MFILRLICFSYSTVKIKIYTTYLFIFFTLKQLRTALVNSFHRRAKYTCIYNLFLYILRTKQFHFLPEKKESTIPLQAIEALQPSSRDISLYIATSSSHPPRRAAATRAYTYIYIDSSLHPRRLLARAISRVKKYDK